MLKEILTYSIATAICLFLAIIVFIKRRVERVQLKRALLERDAYLYRSKTLKPKKSDRIWLNLLTGFCITTGIAYVIIIIYQFFF